MPGVAWATVLLIMCAAQCAAAARERVTRNILVHNLGRAPPAPRPPAFNVRAGDSDGHRVVGLGVPVARGPGPVTAGVTVTAAASVAAAFDSECGGRRGSRR